ncbi:shikimate dehydrogenase [Candidatus Gottesmanbacteria bacterium]|nr:shikimate dehydrogenase [Candidatus Gottesmanbacteria bacterium]
MKINGETQIIGFFGSTYKTSKMYAMYNAAFHTLNLNYIYVPFIVNDLKKAVEGIRNLGIKGVGVTIPYKIAIVKYLDELDENAKRIGAVNVVINNNGKLIGGNTDGLGGVKALKEVTKISGKKVILLGAGGAARALAFAIKDEDGNLVIVNRTEEIGDDLAKAVGSKFIQFHQLDKEIKDADILINATSIGMAPNDNKSLVDKQFLHSDLIVMDIVTNPKETKLLKMAKKMRCKIVYGERMLFWQAVLKFKLFTGIGTPIKVMEESLYA